MEATTTTDGYPLPPSILFDDDDDDDDDGIGDCIGSFYYCVHRDRGQGYF